MKRFLAGLLLSLWATVASAGVTCTVPFNLQNGTTADATQVMANYNAILTCLGNAAAAGANSDITALTGLTTPLTYTAGGSSVYIGGTSTGSANAQVIATTIPNGFSLLAGKRVVFIAGFTNTGPLQINVNATGLTSTVHAVQGGTSALVGGEVAAGSLVEAVYNGTSFELFVWSTQLGGVGTPTTLTATATVNLAAAFSHYAQISGTTSITSFAASADANFPFYRLYFNNGPLTLTQNASSMILPGAANITAATGDTALAEYLGSGNWRIAEYQPANGTAVTSPTPLCGAVGLNITNDGTTPDTKIDITADSAVMLTAGNVAIYATSVSVVINDTVNGANGLDTGNLANNTFYYHWLISNGTTTAGLDSLSATAPTMPATYTYKCRLGASKTNGSAQFYRFLTTGATTQYVVDGTRLTSAPVVSTGTVGSGCAGSAVWSTQGVQANSGAAPVWVPATATDVEVIAGIFGTNAVSSVAPNSKYAANSTNPPLINLVGVTGDQKVVAAWMKLESTNIFLCTATTQFVGVLAWKDKVNAN